jgi:hypothetical protein
MDAKYRKWCAGQQNLPLFAQDWWLDAVCGKENWRVITASSGDYDLALPVYEVKIKGIRRLVQPPWTQYHYLCDLNGQFSNIQDTYQRNITLKEFLESFPSTPIVEINLNPQFQDGLGFQWAGFHLQTRYSMMIEVHQKEMLFEGYSKNLRRNIKAAQRLYTVEPSSDASLLYQVIQETLVRKKAGVQPEQEVIHRMFEALLERKQGRFFVAREADKSVAGGVLVAWDDAYTYYIIGGQQSQKGKPSPHSILMHTFISESLAAGRTFDFCGSMIPGVARFFSSFGAKTRSFLQVSKYSGPGRLKKMKQLIR